MKRPNGLRTLREKMVSADLRLRQKHQKRASVRIASLLGAGLLMVSVAGCGTVNSPSQATQSSGQTANQGNSQTSQGTNQMGNQTEGQSTNQASGGSGTNTGSNTTTVSISKQKPLTYDIEGMTETKPAAAYISNNQPFYMYVLSGYQATPEEPGKDIVSNNVNPDAWMRVEVLQGSVTDQQMEQDARNILASTSKSVHAIATKDLPSNPFFQTCNAWYANGSSETSMVYAAKINGTSVRFFVHLPKEWESPAQFQAMMSSVQVLQSGQTVSAS